VQIYGSSEKTASTFAFSWFDATANYRVDNDFSPLVYQVTNLPPYIKFRFENFVGDSCAGGITVKFIPTPIPNVQATRGTTIDYGYEERSFPVITGGKLRYGGYNVASTQLTDIQDLLVKDGGFAHSGSDYSATGSPTAVNAVTPASVVYVSGLGQFPILQVQNVGTQDVVCGYASTTSTSQYAFKLYARTASIAETTRTVYGLGGQAYDSGGNLISRTNLYCVSATGVAGSIAIAGY
jgi:hypothetical protein